MAVNAIGIDLGQRRVRVAKMAVQPFRKPECVGFAEAAIDPNEDVPYVVRAVAAIHDAVGGEIPAGAKCAVALPGDRAFTKVFELPFKGRKQVQLTAAGEFEQYVPVDLEDLHAEFRILCEEEGRTRVLGAAVDRAYFRELRGAWSEAGFDPPVVGITSVALAHLAKSERDRTAPWGIVNVGERLTTLAGVAPDQPPALRTVSFGTERIAEAAAKEWGVPAAEAAGRLGEIRIEGAVAEALEPLLTDLRMALFGFRATTGVEFTRIELAGDGAHIPGLAEGLADGLGLPCAIYEGTAEMRAALPPAASAADYACATALALTAGRARKEMNLRSGEFAVKGIRIENKGLVAYFGTLALVVVALLAFNTFGLGTGGRAQVDAMEAQVEEIFRATFPEVTKVVDPVSQAEGKLRELERRVEVLAPKMGGDLTALEALRLISGAMPKDVKVDITELGIDERRIKMGGITTDTAAFTKVHEGLQALEPFERVEIYKSDRVEEGKINFELRISLTEEAR